MKRDLARAWGAHESREQWLTRLCHLPGKPDWVMFKGLGTAYSPSIFTEPWHRITGDIDLLVPPQQLSQAIDSAAQLGFQSFGPNKHRRKAAMHRGYNHPMVHPDYGVLEIHFRFWGDITPEYAAALHQRVQPAEGETLALKQLAAPDLFILASTHFWLSSQKMHWVWLYELWRFAYSLTAEQWQQCTSTTVKYGLQTYVLGGLLAWKRLWNLPFSPNIQTFANQLEAALSPLERMVLPWGLPSATGRLRHLPLLLARRLSGRPTRDGWLGLRRLR